MTILNDCVSSCCSAEIRIEGGVADFIGDDKNHMCTMCNVCVKCGQPCNWKEKEENENKT